MSAIRSVDLSAGVLSRARGLAIVLGLQIPACTAAVLLEHATLSRLWSAVAMTYVVSGIVYLFVYPAYPGSLLLIAIFVIVLLMTVQLRGHLGLGRASARRAKGLSDHHVHDARSAR